MSNDDGKLHIVGGGKREPTPEEVLVEQAIEANRRAQNCLLAIQNELRRYQCMIEPLISISGSGKMQGNWAVIPLAVITPQ